MASSEDVIKLLSEDDYLHDPIQFDIDNDLRIVTIPKDGNIIGVVGDKNTNRVNFRMPRYYNGFDMSEFQVRVNYKNVNQKTSYYEVNDLTTAVKTETTDEDKLLFTWLVDSDVCEAHGNVDFSVRMLKTADDGTIIQEFNTTIATGLVLEGLDAYVSGIKNNVDLLNRLRADVYVDVLNKIGGIGGGGSGTAIPLISTFEKLENDSGIRIEKLRFDAVGTSNILLVQAYNSAATTILSGLFNKFNSLLSGLNWNRVIVNDKEVVDIGADQIFREAYSYPGIDNHYLVIEVSHMNEIHGIMIDNFRPIVRIGLTTSIATGNEQTIFTNVVDLIFIGNKTSSYEDDYNTEKEQYEVSFSIEIKIGIITTDNNIHHVIFMQHDDLNTPIKCRASFGVAVYNNVTYIIYIDSAVEVNGYFNMVDSSNNRLYTSNMLIAEHNGVNDVNKILTFPAYVVSFNYDASNTAKSNARIISSECFNDILCTTNNSCLKGYLYNISDNVKYLALTNNMLIKLQEV